MPDSRRTSPRVAAVIQVRYRRREDFVLEYARDVSMGGVFVTSEDPLAEGEVVETQFYLPELPRPITMRGKVVRTVRSRTKGLSGMGIAFEAIDEFTHATLIGYLKEMTSDRECVVDRRGKADRFEETLEVEYTSVGDFLIDYSENISKNGIFLRTDDPLPVESVFPMKITLPNQEQIEVTGRVIHAIDADLADQIGRAAGMGIEFLQYHGSSQERLWNYIESLSNG